MMVTLLRYTGCIRIIIWLISGMAIGYGVSLAQLCSTSSGPGCSKLTTSLVNVSLKFKVFSEICQYFLLKKCEKLLQCKSFSHFCKKKSLYLVIKS